VKRAPSYVLVLLDLGLVAVLMLWAFRIMADPARWVTDLVEWDTMAAGFVLLATLAFGALPLETLASAAREVRSGNRGRGLLSGSIAGALLLIPLLWVAVGPVLASHAEARANRVWAATLDPIETFPSRFPDGPASDGARRLEVAAARLGIDLAPPGAPGTRSGPSDRQAYEAVRTAMTDFVSRELDAEDDRPGRPPDAVMAWLSAHAAGVADLVDEVRRAGPIVLQTDWSAEERPLPSLLGMRGACALLVLSAFEREGRGDSVAASERLEAAWRIGSGLRDRAEFLHQLLAMGLDTMTLKALRKVRDVPPAWSSVIGQADYRRAMSRGIEEEAWEWSARVARLKATGVNERAWLALKGPAYRLMAADYSQALARALVVMRGNDRCAPDRDALEGAAAGSLARWNSLGWMSMPSAVRAWVSAEEASLHVELTRIVLEARALKRSRGRWPEQLEGLDSRVCPSATWQYARSSDGGVTLGLSRKPSHARGLTFRAGPGS